MKWHLTDFRPESDHTDELPVLSEEAILAFDRRGPLADKAVRDPLESSVEALRDALDLAERRWTALESRLETQDRAITDLHGRLSPAKAPDAKAGPAQSADEPEVPVLRAIVTVPAAVPMPTTTDEPAATPVPTTTDEPAATPVPTTTDGPTDVPLPTTADGPATEIDDGGAGNHSLLEKIASLESYIAGRADRWQNMEQELMTRARRITELELELEQRIEREQRLEDRLHDENDRANELRDKLRQTHRRLDEIEVNTIDSDLDATANPGSALSLESH